MYYQVLFFEENENKAFIPCGSTRIFTKSFEALALEKLGTKALKTKRNLADTVWCEKKTGIPTYK